MTDFLSLIKVTPIFKAIKEDKRLNQLSHAYMMVCPDKDCCLEYLKVLAKLILCKDETFCGECKSCVSIAYGSHPDVIVLPEKDEDFKVDSANKLVEESYIKPLEAEKKIFLIKNAESMNTHAQNKLLKTLEEPPKNVIILIGTTSVYPLLPTVLSRVKKFEMPSFSEEKIFNALSKDFPDEKRLKEAIILADGKVGKVRELYYENTTQEYVDLALKILSDMKSSKDLLVYSNKVTSLKSLSEFLSVLETVLSDLLKLTENKAELIKNKQNIERLKLAYNFKTASVIHAIESVNEANKKLKFNANPTMVVEWLLFQILEGKFKWQKS